LAQDLATQTDYIRETLEELIGCNDDLSKDLLRAASHRKHASENQQLIVEQQQIHVLLEEVDSMPKSQRCTPVGTAPRERQVGPQETCRLEVFTTKQERDPNPAARVCTEAQQKVLKEYTKCNDPRLDMDKSKHKVDKLRQQLQLAIAVQQLVVAQLVAVQNELYTAQKKNRCHRFCLFQREKEIMEMKLGLAQNKCKEKEALISTMEDVSKDASLKICLEVLRKKEQELIKLEKETELLNSVEEELETRMLDLEDVQMLEKQECSSVQKQLQDVQNEIKHHDCEACQLREQLAREMRTNKKLKAQKDMYDKIARQTCGKAGPAQQSIHQHAVLRQVSPSGPLQAHQTCRRTGLAQQSIPHHTVLRQTSAPGPVQANQTCRTGSAQQSIRQNTVLRQMSAPGTLQANQTCRTGLAQQSIRQNTVLPQMCAPGPLHAQQSMHSATSFGRLTGRPPPSCRDTAQRFLHSGISRQTSSSKLAELADSSLLALSAR